MNVPDIQVSSTALPSPYLLFLGDITQAAYAKTAFGIRDWAGEHCLGEYALVQATVTVGLERLTPAQAVAAGAKSMVIGVANAGGQIAEAWVPHLVAALEAGLDLVSGMHSRLSANSDIARAAVLHNRNLIDVRLPPRSYPIATGRKRTGKRLLTVGTDCAVGKKYTALSLARAFHDNGIRANFRATGQTGILIAGDGVPLDAVVADFLAGAAETLSPDADPDHWDIVEGQGSLFHPAYAGVSLGLLHGTQPDIIVLCHHATRREMIGMPGFPLPKVEEAMECNLFHAKLTNPAVRCEGISVNTSELSAIEAERFLAELSDRTGLHCADPIRGGHLFAELVGACLR